jgi:hypothetical protein
MISPNEFWLQLHRLAEAYHAEGLTPDERVENIVAQYRDLALPARRQVMTDLTTLMVHMPDVYAALVPLDQHGQAGGERVAHEGAA